MKKVILLILLAALLTGCGNNGAEETTVKENLPKTLYDADSAIEAETNGAVRSYTLETEDSRWIALTDKNLLIASEKILTAISGESGEILGTLEFPNKLPKNYYAGSNGFAYYDAVGNKMQFYNGRLHLTRTVDLPEDIQGFPWFSEKNGEVIYSVPGELKAHNPKTGITRMLKKHTFKSLQITGVAFGGDLLICETVDALDTTATAYLSVTTGQTLSTDGNIQSLETVGEKYFALRKAGAVTQQLFGNFSGKKSALKLPEEDVRGALALNGVLGIAKDKAEKTVISLYSLKDGKKISKLTLDCDRVISTAADGENGVVWLLVQKGEEQTLLHWESAKTPVKGKTSYIKKLYTASNPDTAGLEKCQEKVDKLNRTHGINIRIYKEAVKVKDNYALEIEHQPAAINRCLNELSAVLKEFPKNFLYKGVAKRVRFCIVRSVDNLEGGAFFWQNADPFIVLSAGCNVRDEVMKAMGYIVDSHVLGNSAMYDYWETNNPEGFIYGQTNSTRYLVGEHMAFMDAISLRSGVDDRSRVFYNAMLPDNAKMFQTEATQNKLIMLCKAIRKAWRLEREEAVYPWEQYLKESIAYVDPEKK